MALKRFHHLPPEQRAAILEKAANVFAEQGYAECSYNELLRELGMGKSQAYYYFAGKADLFLTAVAACYERFYDEAATLALPRSADEFWDYVRRLTLLGFRYQSEDPVTSKLTRALLGSEVRFCVADFLMSSEGTSREQHERWVRLGQELGAVRTDLDRELLVRLSLEFAQTVDGFFAERAESVTSREPERYAVIFTDLTRRLFTPAVPAPCKAPAAPKKKKGAR